VLPGCCKQIIQGALVAAAQGTPKARKTRLLLQEGLGD
jgi:hypothetical protein